MTQSSTTASSGSLSDLNFGSFFGFDPLNHNGDSNSNSNNNIDLDDKRKKPSTFNTCIHCQKAQLTCDGSRPCQQCIKRDLATTCTDGSHRKEKQETFDQFTPATSYSQQDTSLGANFLDTSQLLNFSLADLGFGSETAGLEYGVIGNMLQTPLDLMSGATAVTSSSPSSASTSITTPTSMVGNGHMISTTSSATSMASTHSPHTTTTPAPAQHSHIDSMISSSSTSIAFNPAATTSASFSSNGPYSFSASMSPTKNMLLNRQQSHSNNWANTSSPPNEHHSHPHHLNGNMKRESVVSTSNNNNATPTSSSSRRKGSNGNTPEQVYNSVRKPFNYAEGFHYLIQYVKQRMGRDDLMRISRALALIRPSFLALIMNLTEEDLVFMEKCFQRTLLEYEKLISFSGTPTVVWRRTGEVCLAGKEFSLLTQWTKDALLGKKTYIYELMDNQSAVEYWEQFSRHAFDNTDKACIHSCILRTPQQRPVPCTFCFTIKRDIFDLPSVIVGNFLPILS
ncbi:hypothetical protein BCR42DRAFT_400373 [Absidia repens]|uniref:Zn(2)-C6 fungal-type domain-containing protein n=1 Tax=Absidia repens TaxID=90262 RepID=A0A1X2J0Z8_9FUNG|nr:hypothetical protein BCR42DRAFT_400373 [Absidia repens]